MKLNQNKLDIFVILSVVLVLLEVVFVVMNNVMATVLCAFFIVALFVLSMFLQD